MKRYQEHIISFFINVPTFYFFGMFNSKLSQWMNRTQGCPIYWSTFAEFKREFDKQEWEHQSNRPDSLFGIDGRDDNYLHASVMKINGVCHNLTTYGQLRANAYIRKKINELSKPIYLKQLP